MRMPALLLGAFLLAGCGAAPQAGASASRTAVASPSASPSPSPSASPSASGSPPAGVQAHCTGAIPTAAPLALINLTGSPPPTLAAREDDRTITTLPPVPGRGISPDDDSLMIAFSPDGAYLALVETFTGSGTGAQASFQVRRLDGSLVSGGPAGRTMATWAGRGSVLYFRDRAGVERWTAPSTVSAVLPGVVWIHPRPSPDGRWIAFTQRGDLGLPSVRLLDLTSGAVRQLATGASEPVFLNSSTVWYRQERLCGPSDDCGMGGPSITTGAAFVYDLSSGRSSQSTIAGVLDTFTPAR